MVQQKIYFVSGKGGVGKSTLALALATCLANQGQKTLLVELVDQSYFKEFLGLESVSYKPQLIQNQLYLSQWRAMDCLKEYVSYLLHNESLGGLFFKSPAITAIIETAPAIQQLAILGKITSGIRHVGPPLDFANIVVDAYASGHFKALLQAPIGIQQAVSVGPIAQQSRQIVDVLKNPEITQFILATLPEEMPIVEMKEQHQDIEKVIGQKAQIWFNKVEEELPANSTRVAEFLKKKREQQQKLMGQLTLKYSQIPMLYEYEARELIEGLALRIPQ